MSTVKGGYIITLSPNTKQNCIMALFIFQNRNNYRRNSEIQYFCTQDAW